MNWPRAWRRRVLRVVACTVMLGGASAVIAQPGHAALVDQAQHQNRALEVDVTNSAAEIHGQPDIAVNPRDPRNLVFTSTVFSGTGAVAEFAPCFVAYSRYGGATWTQVPGQAAGRPAVRPR